MSKAKLFLAWSLSAAVGLAAASTAAADTLLVDRGLPSDNLNVTTLPNPNDRSNVRWAWGPQASAFVGDSFKVGGTGPYEINTLRVWFVAGNVANSPTPTPSG